jgi:hypothetical protein
LPHISGFVCNQLLTSSVWICPQVNIHICRQMQSFKRLIRYLLGCLHPMLGFILLLSQYRLSNMQDMGVTPRSKSIELLQVIFQVLRWMNHLMAGCPFITWMVAKEACSWIQNCHLDNHCNCWVSCCDPHQDHLCVLIICLSWC